MIWNPPPPRRERTNKTCVLYDKDSGAIRHIQRTIVMDGGYEPTEPEIEAMARRSFERRSKPHTHLHALHVTVGEIKYPKIYRVDTARKVLVEMEPK